MMQSNEVKRYLITSALPYANGPIHIGHLAGVYVPADIYVRYRRLHGDDVVWVCGSDEHGVPITIRAREEGVTPQEVVDKYDALIRSSFKDFGMSFDIYSRTSHRQHYQVAADFFKKLHAEGHFIEQESEQYYDETAQQFLADRYITGECPRCGYDHAYGDQCEKCGSTLNATELINPKSTLSGSKPVLRKTKHWYLPLDRWQEFLEKWILEDHKEWKSSVLGQCKSWLDGGLQPRAVSRDLNWGVPVPLDGAEGKVLYVWFDAPIGYITATQELLPDRWETYWKDKGTKMVHFIGKDNIVFHCIVFPAMLKAHGDYILPENVPANEFLNLEGDKLSTSRNWAVWLHEYLQEFPGCQDSLRYTLTANMPEAKDNDFTWKDFQSRNNSDLVGVLGNFINRAMVLTQNYYAGQVPQPSAGLLPQDKELLHLVAQQQAKIECALEGFRFREALKEFMQIARWGNKYLADEEPWKVVKTDPERVKSIIYTSLQVGAVLAVLGEPFLPFSAKRMQGMLNIDPKLGWLTLSGRDEYLTPGTKLGTPELLFRKIEDAEIEKQLARLHNRREEMAREKSATYPEQKPLVDFEQFSALDLRVGRIEKAERVPKTAKLLKLQVNIGYDTRTIVSGIGDKFTPEELIGQQTMVVVNLKPRRIKGVESEGMLIFAESAQGNLHLMQPRCSKEGNGTNDPLEGATVN